MAGLKIVHLSETEETRTFQLLLSYQSLWLEEVTICARGHSMGQRFLTCNQVSVSGRNPLIFSIDFCVYICFLLWRVSVIFTRLSPRYICIGLRIKVKAQNLGPDCLCVHPGNPTFCLCISPFVMAFNLLSLRFFNYKMGKIIIPISVIVRVVLGI